MSVVTSSKLRCHFSHIYWVEMLIYPKNMNYDACEKMVVEITLVDSERWKTIP